jgi:hypothetical protein
MHRDAPATVVRMIRKSWTHPLDGEPRPALIEINIGIASEQTDACTEITPGQARTVATALLELADTRRARPKRHVVSRL